VDVKACLKEVHDLVLNKVNEVEDLGKKRSWDEWGNIPAFAWRNL
jgi:translation initiation factor 2 alpha subunit (eIF-2alpha)